MNLTPESLETTCTITLDNGAITNSHLVVKGKVPGATAEQFAAAVKDAEANCPISKLFNTSISSEAILA
jgi:osmotically inducible protein OsmC